MSSPILYDKTATDFFNLGKGVLHEATSCYVDEERNGMFELQMEYPISGALFGLLENDMIIKADAGHALKDQLFRIKRITKKDNGIAEVYAQHVSYLTQDLALRPEVNLSGTAYQALAAWKGSILDDNPFVVQSDISTTNSTSLTLQDFENARQVLGGVEGSILDVWGGEYKFDNYNISLLSARGGNANTLISYGRNLTSLEQEESIASTYTSLFPFAVYTAEGADKETIVTVNGYIVDSEHVSKYPNRRVLYVDFSNEFGSEEIPTPNRLLTLAEQYIKNNEIGVPTVNLSLSFVDLTKSLNASGIPYEEVNLCDTVPVIFDKLGIETRAKIIRIRWDVLLDKYERLEIGQARASLSDRLNVIESNINEVSNNTNYALIAANGRNTVFYGPDTPTANRVGDLWYKPNGEDTELYMWNGSVWEFVMSTVPDKRVLDAIAEAESAAREAQKAADKAQEVAADAQAAADDALKQVAEAQKDIDAAQKELDEALDGLAAANEKLENLSEDLEQNTQVISDAMKDVLAIENLLNDWKYDDTVYIDGGKLYAGTVTAREILAGSITSVEVATRTLVAENIKAGSLTANELAVGTITAESGIIGSINANVITAGTLNVDRLAAQSITGQKLAMKTITAEHITAGTLTSASGVFGDISAASITSGYLAAARIQTGSLDATVLKARSITSASGVIGSLSASDITTGTLNAANVNIINLNVSNLTGNLTNFVQSNWNSISNEVQINSTGVELMQNGTRRAVLKGYGLEVYSPTGTFLGALEFMYQTGNPENQGLRMYAARGARTALSAQLNQDDNSFGYTRLHVNGENGEVTAYGNWYFSGLNTPNADSNARAEIKLWRENVFRARYLGTTGYTTDHELLIQSKAAGGVGILLPNEQAGIDIMSDGKCYIRDGGVSRRVPRIIMDRFTYSSITPNTPTRFTITFSTAFKSQPRCFVTPITTVPGTTVLGMGVSNVTTTGCEVYLTRTNSTLTAFDFMAISYD